MVLLRGIVPAATKGPVSKYLKIQLPWFIFDSAVMKEFEDIKITNLNVEKTAPSSRGSAMRHIYLELSATPPSDWIDRFNEERKFPRHTMWRKAWVEGKFIVIDCVPDEIEQYHLKDLKEDVAKANNSHRQALGIRNAKQEALKNAADGEKKRLEDLRSRLNFE